MPPPENKPDKPGQRDKMERLIKDWIAYDCPPAGKSAIDDNLIELLVDRLVPGEATPVLPLKHAEQPIEKPDLIQPKPPDLIKPPEKPPSKPDPIKPEPTVKPKRW